MARGIYFDCFSGASGDMLLGALVDAGAPLDALIEGLRTLPLQGWSFEAQSVVRSGLKGSQLHIRLDAGEPQPTRALADVRAVIEAGALSKEVQQAALGVFGTLAQAEAAVHGTAVSDVHFHEVGAVDAIVDVVGVCLALELLEVPRAAIHSSGLPLGFGWMTTLHGPLPAPGPAVVELLRLAGAPTRRPPRADAEGELTTPTGAALLTTLARFEEPRFRRLERVGYGFGTREPGWPNAVRVLLGELAPEQDALLRDEAVVLETNLDDATPEQLGFAMERLLDAGALDVAFSPLQMKKNRPGVMLTVIAPPARADDLALLMLSHTTALGVRAQRVERYVAPRAERLVVTPWGEVRVKEKRLHGHVTHAPEYEDCARLAREYDLSLALVFDTARSLAAPAGS